MSIHLQRDLELLEQNLLNQSSMVERMVYRSVESLRELRADIAQEVLASEETVNSASSGPRPVTRRASRRSISIPRSR